VEHQAKFLVVHGTERRHVVGLCESSFLLFESNFLLTTQVLNWHGK